MKPKHPSSLLLAIACCFFAACTNCPDIALDADLARFFPYQANQNLVFEDAAQNMDTIMISSFSRGNEPTTCADNPNQDFQLELVHATFGTIGGDSLFLLMDNTTEKKMAIRYEVCCDPGNAYDPLTGTLDQPINNNYETFAFQASEVVNGVTYQFVATHSRTALTDTHIRTVKVAIDHGVVAYETDQGTWWFLQ